MGRRTLIALMLWIAACGRACASSNAPTCTDTANPPAAEAPPECASCPKSCCLASSIPNPPSAAHFICADPIVCRPPTGQWARSDLFCVPIGFRDLPDGGDPAWPSRVCLMRENSAVGSSDDYARCFDTTERCIAFPADASLGGYVANVPGNIKYP